ncbi:MAG: hypothetical protein ACLR89_19555 [Bacteroides uniformis]
MRSATWLRMFKTVTLPAFPSKEQTEAVNDYLRSVHADGDGSTSERNCEHRRIASQNITIAAIPCIGQPTNWTGFKMCLTTLHTTRSIICRREDAECTDDFLFWLHHL